MTLSLDQQIRTKPILLLNFFYFVYLLHKSHKSLKRFIANEHPNGLLIKKSQKLKVLVAPKVAQPENISPSMCVFFFFLTVQYQMEMMRSLRHVNIDHLHVGWYQSTFFGSFMSRALLDSQFSYQHAIEESVVLIYGTVFLSFHLSVFLIMRIARTNETFPALGLILGFSLPHR